MKEIKPPLLLYMISGFLFFLSIIINNEFLTLVSKPVISTSMFFHYFHESRGKVNFWFSVVLLLLFVSGVFNLFEDEFALQYVILINFLSRDFDNFFRFEFFSDDCSIQNLGSSIKH